MRYKTWQAVIWVCMLSGCSLGEVHELGCRGNGKLYNHNANACLEVNGYGIGEFQCDDGEWKPLVVPFVQCVKCNAGFTACETRVCVDGEKHRIYDSDNNCVSQTCQGGFWVDDVDNQCSTPACEGENCKESECTEENATETCSEGESCRDGMCVATEPEEDPDCIPSCAKGQICANGKCIEPDVPIEGAFSLSDEEIWTLQHRTGGTFKVYLNSAPEASVVIPVKSENESVGTVLVAQVEFTSENWSEPQSVEIVPTKKTQAIDVTDYRIIVGPTQSEDAHFDGLPAQSVLVKHYNQLSTLKLDKTEASLLLRKPKGHNADGVNSVTFNAVLPEGYKDSVVRWDIKNASDKIPWSELVEIKDESCDAEKGTCVLTLVRKNIPLTSEATTAKKLDLARRLEITASAENLNSAKATLELKPYLPLGFYYSYYINNIRDFDYKVETGNLECDYYDKTSAHVFDEDMYKIFVEPKMYKNEKGELLPTRASVLAAARFLVLQFPKDIPYSTTSKCIKDEKGSKTCTIGGIDYQMTCKTSKCVYNYIWTSTSTKSEYDYKERQLYGLHLLPEGYNTLTNMSSAKPIIDNLHPWGCRYTDDLFNTNEIYSKACKRDSRLESGLNGSGFVNWAMRNGMFDLGNLATDAFAMMHDSTTGKNTMRRYKDIDAFYGSDTSINRNIQSAEKLSGLKDSDFVALKDVDKENQIGMKAGDLLWYSDVCKCEPKQKCPSQCDCHSGGHLAMILGFTYSMNSTTERNELNSIYVAEGIAAGNRMTVHKIDKDNKLRDWNCVDDKCYQPESCREVKLIKMGNVYNYYTDKGDTYGYQDKWW